MMMTKTLLGGVAFAVAMLATPGTALAQTTTTITFDGQSNIVRTAPITRLGYIIGNPTGQTQHFHEQMKLDTGLPESTTSYLVNDRDTQIFVTSQTTGALFSLLSVDVASATTGIWAAEKLTISGYLAGVLTGSITVGINGSWIEDLDGSALGTFDTLIFDGIDGGGGFVLDNIVLRANSPGPIPEPATWAMMLLGFGAIGYQARRKKRALARAAA